MHKFSVPEQTHFENMPTIFHGHYTCLQYVSRKGGLKVKSQNLYEYTVMMRLDGMAQ